MKYLAALLVVAAVMMGSSRAEMYYVVKFMSDGLERTGWEATFDTAQQCNDYRASVLNVCRLAWLPKKQVPKWVKDIVYDKTNPTRDVCRHREHGRQSRCEVVSVVPNGAPVAVAPPPPPPTYWHIWARPPVGSPDRRWGMLSDGPFTSRFDCEAVVIKNIRASNITDHKVMDDFQCFEDKTGS